METIVESLWLGYRQWADKYITQDNRTRLKIFIAVVLVFISGFLAWRDENEKWQKEHDTAIAAKTKLDALEAAKANEINGLNETIGTLRTEADLLRTKQRYARSAAPTISHDRDRLCEEKVPHKLKLLPREPNEYMLIPPYEYELTLKPKVPLWHFYIITTQDITFLNVPGQAMDYQKRPDTAEYDRVMEVSFKDAPLSGEITFVFTSNLPTDIRCIGRSH